MKLFQYLLFTLNLFLFLIMIGLLLIVPEEKTLNLFCVSSWLFLTLFLIIKEKDTLIRVYKSDFRKFFTTNFISIFLTLCILCLINFISVKNPIQFDLTKNGNNSISQKSINVIKKFEDTVTFNIFAKKIESAFYSELIELYRFHYKDLKVNVIEPHLRPDLISKYKITKNNTLVIEYKNKRIYVSESSEKAITNALLNVVRDIAPKVLITQNHGEFKFNGQGQQAISFFIEKAKQGALKVEPGSIANINSNLKSSKKIDYDLIVSINPIFDFSKDEISYLENHIERGGHLLIAMGAKVENTDKSLLNLESFLSKHGFEIKDDLIIDRLAPTMHKTTPLIIPVSNFNKTHRAFSNIKSTLFFPFSRSIKAKDSEKNQINTLATSSSFPVTWGETTYSNLQAGESFNAKFENELDNKGPLAVFATKEIRNVSDSKNASKISLLGSSLLFSNGYINLGENLNFIMNLLSWKLNDEIVKFTSLSTGNDPIIISVPHQMLLLFSSVIVIPVMLLVFAFYFYKRNSN